jgi:hypothetical protein
VGNYYYPHYYRPVDFTPYRMRIPAQLQTITTYVFGGIIRVGTPSAVTRRHRLAHLVTVNGTGAKKRIMAWDRRTGEYVGSTISDENGEWEMQGLKEYPEGVLIVVALDDNGEYNADVVDHITQATT